MTPRPARDALVGRLRDVLADVLERNDDIREVAMFGGVAFMVAGRMAVSAGREGDLLVHVDPRRHAALLDLPGAAQAVMGERSMGPRWLTVAAAHLDDDALRDWVARGLPGITD